MSADWKKQVRAGISSRVSLEVPEKIYKTLGSKVSAEMSYTSNGRRQFVIRPDAEGSALALKKDSNPKIYITSFARDSVTGISETEKGFKISYTSLPLQLDEQAKILTFQMPDVLMPPSPRRKDPSVEAHPLSATALGILAIYASPEIAAKTPGTNFRCRIAEDPEGRFIEIQSDKDGPKWGKPRKNGAVALEFGRERVSGLQVDETFSQIDITNHYEKDGKYKMYISETTVKSDSIVAEAPEAEKPLPHSLKDLLPPPTVSETDKKLFFAYLTAFKGFEERMPYNYTTLEFTLQKEYEVETASEAHLAIFNEAKATNSNLLVKDIIVREISRK